jgi:hypothetical protein
LGCAATLAAQIGDAKRVNFAPMRIMPIWFYRGAVLLIFLGIFTVSYLLIRFIGFIAGVSH